MGEGLLFVDSLFDEVGEIAGVIVHVVAKASREILDNGEEDCNGDEDVFEVGRPEVDGEDGNERQREENPAKDGDPAGVDFGSVEVLGIVGVEAALIEDGFARTHDNEDATQDEEDCGVEPVVPEKHEVPGTVAWDEGHIPFPDGVAENFVTARTEDKGSYGEAEGEKQRNGKDPSLVERGTAGFSEGTDPNVIHWGT